LSTNTKPSANLRSTHDAANLRASAKATRALANPPSPPS
jgi:hypothetical protein